MSPTRSNIFDSADGGHDSALAAVYRDADHYDLLATMTAPDDGAFYQRLVARFPGAVLELGCGTGRVALPLAAQGVAITGLDISPAMVARAASKAAEAQLQVEFHQADMRDFTLGRTFSLIIIPYNGFNHLETIAEVKSCLAAVRRHLAPGGRLCIDTFNPDPRQLRLVESEPRKILFYRHPESGARVTLLEQNCYDAMSQVNRITWRYTVDGEGETRVDQLRMRHFFPQELEALLELGGFAVEEKLGDYQERPFASFSPKQLTLCRLAHGEEDNELG